MPVGEEPSRFTAKEALLSTSSSTDAAGNDKYRVRVRARGSPGFRLPLAIAAAGTILTFGLFFLARQVSLRSFHTNFQADVSVRSRLVQDVLKEFRLILSSTGRYLGAPGAEIDQERFRRLASSLRNEGGGMDAVMWAPVSSRGGIRTGATAGAGVLLVEPLTRETSRLLGMDVGAAPGFRPALERARDTGTEAATGKVALPGQDGESRIVVFSPVYSGGKPLGTVEQRCSALRGFVIGILRPEVLLESALRETKPIGLPFDFLDFSSDPADRVLSRWPARLKGRTTWKTPLFSSPPHGLGRLFFAGREWGIDVAPNQAYLCLNHPVGYWGVLPAGFVLTILLAATIGIEVRAREKVDAAEREIRDSNRKFESLIKASPIGIATIDAGCNLTLWNPALERMFGWTSEEVLGHPIPYIPPEKSGEHAGILARIMSGEAICGAELLRTRKDGSPIHISMSTAAYLDDAGNITGVVGVIQEITGRKQAEEAIRTSLREKEVLLKEIHHRVKNNMTVISSLLSLQGDRITDPAVRMMFDESRQRIKSMALVHETLYASADLSQIDMGGYVRRLVDGLLSSFRQPGREVVARIDVGNVPVDVVTAVPCGLILNELVTNALKYAFEGRDRGELAISLTKEGAAYSLKVKDDGIGLPVGFDPRNTGTLGLMVVDVLARQLGGEARFESDGGTEATVTFTQH